MKKSTFKILLSVLLVILSGIGILVFTVIDFQKNQKDYHPKVDVVMNQVKFKAIDVTGNQSMYQNAQKISDLQSFLFDATNNISSKNIEQLRNNSEAPTIIFFGFTHCPEVCPTFLTKMTHVFTKLAEYKIKTLVQPNLLFITVDPKRDSVEQLKKYLSNFKKSGVIGLHHDNQEQLPLFLKRMKIFVEIQNTIGKDTKNYNVDHTTSALVYDKKGFLRLYARDTLSIDDWVHDLKNL